MRFASKPVKLRIANVCPSGSQCAQPTSIERLSKSAVAAVDREPPSSHGKTPQTSIYSHEFRRFEGLLMRQMAVGGQIDENGSLPYKPRQLSAMTRSVRGGSFWAGNGPLWPASIRGLTSFIRQIVSLSGNVVSGEQP